MLRYLGWSLDTEVSEQRIGHIFKAQAGWSCFTVEDDTDRLS